MMMMMKLLKRKNEFHSSSQLLLAAAILSLTAKSINEKCFLPFVYHQRPRKGTLEI